LGIRANVKWPKRGRYARREGFDSIAVPFE
jgi:hypothetical protein